MVNTFTLNVTPTSRTMFIYPDGSVVTQHLAVGNVNNYDCINEIYDVPVDTDYVYTTSIAVVSDVYSLSDHTTESGTVNYITVFCRAKSHLYTPSSSATYDIQIGVKDASSATWTYYKSSEATYGTTNILNTDYNLFSCMWTSNPSSQTVWSWTDIDNLRAGILCSSPSLMGASQTFIIRPTSDVSVELNRIGASSNFDCVDETIPNYNDDYVYNDTKTFKRDLYGATNHTTESGPISNLTIFNCARCGSSYTARIWIYIKTNGTEYNSGYWEVDNAWNVYSYNWNSNPSTSVAWTWADIDSLEIGTGLLKVFGLGQSTQLYGIVDYTADYSPEIRTSNCYIKVNYTPSTTTYYLNKPIDYEFNNNRELKKLNFWNGERRVYDLQRSSKTLSMTGIEFNTSSSEATDRMNNMITLKDEGSEITISGFTDNNVNTTWYVRDFKYSRDENNPYVFNWSLELEKA